VSTEELLQPHLLVIPKPKPKHPILKKIAKVTGLAWSGRKLRDHVLVPVDKALMPLNDWANKHSGLISLTGMGLGAGANALLGAKKP
jgi:hypothetical protein